MERAAVVTASKLNRDPLFYFMLIEGNWKVFHVMLKTYTSTLVLTS